MKRTMSVIFGLLASTLALGQSSDEGKGYTGTPMRPFYRPEGGQIGLKVGAAQVDDLDASVPTYGIFVAFPVGEYVLFGGGLDYWMKDNGKLSDTTVDVQDIAGAIDAKIIATDQSADFRPFILVGASAHRFLITESDDATRSQANELNEKYKKGPAKFGVDYGGGLMYRLSNLANLVGEVRYRDLPKSGTKLNQLALTGGLTFTL